ncbi:MAG TPA: DUF4388 domain-containing protein [candidate division Zixibacteria bacterium]|nr:DUF4388 domain-containing protein [candidate division Zixibacteria bacterium]HEQ99683.1 DUF4388 domain-containing protein [candidate division Zixibacteria bacterium]
MSFTGNLKTVAFPDILQLLSSGKKTGILVITKGKIQKEICFKDGNIIGAYSKNAEEDFLGNLLLKQGRISRIDLERALHLHKSTGKKLGMVLVDMELIDHNEIGKILKLQVEEIVFNLFSWHEGEFVFQEGKLPPEKEFFVELNTMNMLMEGTRRIDEWVEITKGLPKDEELLRVVLTPETKTGEVTISLDQFQVLSLINGERTVPDIVSESPVGEFITKRGLHQLLQAGLIEVAGIKKESKTEQFGDDDSLWWLLLRLYSSCFAAIRRNLDQKLGPDNQKVREHLSRYSTGVWGFFSNSTSSDFRTTFNKFKTTVQKIPKEAQVYRMLSGLNQILTDQMSLVSSLLGDNVRRQVASEIRKEIAMPLAEKREINKKFGIERDLARALTEFRQVKNA